MAVAGAAADRLLNRPQAFATVQLDTIVADYLLHQARAGAPPETAKRFALQIETTVDDLAREHGVTLLTANAVIGGSIPDLTSEARARLGVPEGVAIRAAGHP